MESIPKKEIFREYDIRGIAGRDLTDPVVHRLGQSFGTFMGRSGCRRITLGRDVRLSSGRLRDALTAGLVSTGLEVVDIGICPTPVLYFSLHQLNPDGGIMITGSHNPADYNGFKIAVGKTTVYGEQIQEIRHIAGSGDFRTGKGHVDTRPLLQEYVDYLVGSLGPLRRPVSVVIDCGNGTAGLAAAEIYGRLGCQVHSLYEEPDGRFPHHHPDPTVEANLQDLIREVGRRKAELGIAFDGDADRIGVIDDRGKIIWGDGLMVLFSREILRERPGATIIGEVKCSRLLYDDIKNRGGRAIMWKAGHSLIKAKMKEENAVFAGEMSGHLFFADRYFGYDDAIYAGARLLEICSESEHRLSEMLGDLPVRYSTPEIRVECPEDRKFDLVRRAQEYFSSRYSTVTVDGVRVEFEDGWGLIRASNTQPVLVLRFEAESAQRLEEIRNLIESRLEELQSELRV